MTSTGSRPDSEPVLFAHRGGMAHAPENTLDAFRLAMRLGATGLESDVWPTSDGVPVLSHHGRVGPFYRRRAVTDIAAGSLPATLPSLEDLYRAVGTGCQVSLDVMDPAVTAQVVAVANRHPGALGRLWLCHPDWEMVASWRGLHPRIRLVNSTRLERIEEGPERRAARLAAARIDAINLHQSDWTGGLTALFHRFGLACLGWDAQHERQLDHLFRIGIDGVYSDHVDRMVTRARARRSA